MVEFSINHFRDPSDPKSSPVQIGWFFADDTSSIVYFPPERIRSTEINKEHAKSASRCPAVINLESRYLMVRSPIDLHIGFARDKSGKAILRNLAGQKSTVRASKLNQMLTLVQEPEWRAPNRPIVQLKLPYMFIADEPVYMSQLPAFLHYESKNPQPGTMFGGRFPIDVWPRPLMWAFEWIDLDKPLIIKRGQPLFYCQFEFDSPERSFQFFEAEKTPELQAYMDKISAAVNYVNQTFSLFKRASEVRPDRLLKRKDQ